LLLSDASDTDESLIERANRGDSQAFEALYFRYRDWVARLALRLTGDREDALDVLQETFAYFFGKFPGFVLRAALKTFLYPAVKNLCLSRRRGRQITVDIADLAEILPDDKSTPTGTGLDFGRLVLTLPEPQREVALLRFADDMSLQQISAALGIPLGTVKSRLHNALELLRKQLAR
jgi:RNA polymerase sigma-70 factor (ECF subfamily)